MKNIKTFEQFSADMDSLEEGKFLGMDLGKLSHTKKESFEADAKKKIPAWKAKGYVMAKSLEELVKEAEADDFAGVLGVNSDKEIIYKPAKDVNWEKKFKSGGTGGKTTSGGV